MSERYRKAERKGRRAEQYAALMLMLKGYGILERRWKTPVGEIDLIIRRGRTIAFVEVKARRDIATAIQAVTPTARARISAAADLWVSQANSKNYAYRFDLVTISGWRIRHLKNAWHNEMA
ncbi:MAG: YraN family protein [Parvularculaceae bacterium]